LGRSAFVLISKRSPAASAIEGTLIYNLL